MKKEGKVVHGGCLTVYMYIYIYICIYIYIYVHTYICYPPPPQVPRFGLGHSLRTSLSDPSIPNSRFLAGDDEGKGIKRGLAVNGQEFLVIDGEG